MNSIGGILRSLVLVLIWTVLAVPAAVVVFPWTLITRDTRLLLRVALLDHARGAAAGRGSCGARGDGAIAARRIIVMANHTSNLDPPALIPVLPGRVVMYLKESLMRIPVLGYAMRLAGVHPCATRRHGESRQGQAPPRRSTHWSREAAW